MSEWLLFNTNSAIFQLYHGKNKLLIFMYSIINIKTILFIYNCISGVIKTILFIYNCISGVIKTILFIYNRIGGIIDSEVDCGFEPRSGQTKDYKIGICCFFAKHAALRRKNRLVGLESE